MKVKTFTDKDIDFVATKASTSASCAARTDRAAYGLQSAPELDQAEDADHSVRDRRQSKSRRKLDLPDKAKDVWRLFADRCTTIGVRRRLHAEVLDDLGIENVDIVGCHLFRCNNQTSRSTPVARQAAQDRLQHRRKVSATYAADIKRYLSVQRDFIKRLDERFDLTVTSHGEPPEKASSTSDELIAERRAALIGQGWFENAEEELVKIYRDQMFFSGTVAEHDTFARTMDLVLGFRVHGNLPALANGVPAIFVDYDQRSQELAQDFSIPCLTMDQLEKNDLEALYAPELWNDFNTRYHDNYRRMAAFLDRDGMAHRLATV